MKYLNIVRVGVCLLLFMFLFSEDALAQKKNKKKKDKNKTEQVDSTEFERKFLQASKEKLLGNADKAKTLFLECLKETPENDAVLYELAVIEYEDRNLSEALGYAEKAANFDKANKWYQYLYAELLAKDNQFDKAAQVYDNLSRKSPSNPDLYLDHAYMLRLNEDYKGAIKVLDQLESQIGVEESIIIEKQKLYVQLGDVNSAAGELQKMINAYPNDSRYYRMLADLYGANNMDKQAFETYKKLIEKNPDDPYARLALANHYRSNGEKEKGLTELKAAFRNKELPLDPKIQILISNLGLFEANDKEAKIKESLELTAMLLEAHENAAEVHAIHGDLLLRDNQKEASVESFEKSLDLDSGKFEVWQQLFILQSDLGQFEEMIEYSDKAKTLFPNQSLIYYFNGFANNRLGHKDKAIKSLKKAVLIGSDNESLMAEMHSQLADVYNSQEQYEKSDASFEKALKHEPNNSLVLNNYSYYLSLRDDNLEKAAEMSKRSNELEPNNSSFLDTYGWILYRLQRFEEAKEFIQKSMDNGGKDRPVILDHYGDILYRLNEVDQAVEFWQKAKQLGLDNDVIDRKISDRKVYE